MDFLSVNEIRKEISTEDIVRDAEPSFCACVHKIKKRSGFTFVTLRTGRYTFLAVHNPKYCEKPLKGVFEGVYVSVKCKIREEIKAENGLEIAITDYEILSKPIEKYPLPVSDRVIDCAPEELIEYRAVTFRNPVEKAPMLVFSSAIGGFSDFLRKNDFVEIKTPSITEMCIENKKDVLSLSYFGKEAYLVSDPGVYTQCAVAYFDRVFEVCDVYTGKKRNSPRLLNQYTALHFDMAYVNDTNELMAYVCAVIKSIIENICVQNKNALDLLDAKAPVFGQIPCITFKEVMKLLEKGDEQIDLDPTDEKRICNLVKEKYNSEFVFITEYPTVKRPDYYKENHSFALLFRGMEVGFGGLKKNEYVEDIYSKSYRDFFRYGIPPHGGVSIGAERFIMQLCGLLDIRQVSLFPRDIKNLTP